MKSVVRSGVNINLYSANGKGVFFGQSITPADLYAVYNKLAYKQFFARQFANSGGYINFDGGLQKALHFKLFSYSKHGAAFYMNRGSQNISIKNCLIENGTPGIANNTWMPMTQFSPASGFSFDADTLTVGALTQSYSAGIVNRSTLFSFSALGSSSSTVVLDTITNANNVMSSNEIYGFAYGIVSLGIGPLWDAGKGDYGNWYNKHNLISNNIIHDVTRAGIFFGYEDSTNIIGNKIYNVNLNNASTDAAGIFSAGQDRTASKGYNNQDIVINGNEISGVSASAYVTGVRVEQSRNAFPHAIKGTVYFPNGPDNISVYNNEVWGLNSLNGAAARAGILMNTVRGADLFTPSDMKYFMTGNSIYNNTVVISDEGFTTTGHIVGIALMNAFNTNVKNNAISIKDNDVTQSDLSLANAAIAYVGVMPTSCGVVFDRNAFDVAAKSGIARFVELDSASNVIDATDKTIGRDNFKTMNQWRMWTKQDYNSVVGEFVFHDMNYPLSSYDQKLRVITNPTPLGSILNNRGEILAPVTTDIDGTVRGATGQRYDLGAQEFDGRLFSSDIEMLTITKPAAYQSGTGLFNDAEYITLDNSAPFDINVMLRNNGTLPENSVKVYFSLYRENTDHTWPTTPLRLDTILVNISTSESQQVVDHMISVALPTDSLIHSYGYINGLLYPPYNAPYVVPSQFAGMTANVTPLHMIKVQVESDQNNSNNTLTKIVRFYIKRSGAGLILSTENSATDITSIVGPKSDIIAGRLNADSLKAEFKSINWWTTMYPNRLKKDSCLLVDRFDYDVFDRTGWEPKATDYTIWRSMFWSDGDDKALTRRQRYDIRQFLTVSNFPSDVKKNLCIGSQEMLRANFAADSAFCKEVLRAYRSIPGNPLGDGVTSATNPSNTVYGVGIGTDLTEYIAATKIDNSASYFSSTIPGSFPIPPYSGNMKAYTIGDGLTKTAYYYKNVGFTSLPSSTFRNDSIMGVRTVSLSKNIVYMGVDWRHWLNGSRMLKSLFDFFEKNNGSIVPVELTNFTANLNVDRINVNWETKSENNTSHYEIEKAVKNETGVSPFFMINTVKSNNSLAPSNYGPYPDVDILVNHTYVYRLKMIDLNGDYAYSNEVEVVVGGDQNSIILGEAIPSPARDNVSLKIGLTTASNITVDIVDMSGRTVANVFNGFKSGNDAIDINLSNITSGVYTLVVKSGDVTATKQIQVVK
jgi:hypothetical protein